MASLLDLAGYVQKQGELGRQRGEQSRISSLASQAYTAPRTDRQSILGQMAQTSPGAAVEQEKRFRQGDSDRMADLSRKAKIFVGMAESGNAQAVASLYPQIAQEARDLGLGDIPMEYNDTFLPGLKKFATILDGDQTSEVGVQSTYVDAQGNRVAILRDGSTRTLGQNAPNNQIIDTGNGFFGVNKGNLSASPVMVGGQPQPAPQPSLQAGLYQTPAGMVRIGEGLTPEQQQAALMDIQGGGAVDSVQLPARNVAPQQFGGGQQLRSAPKAQVPSGYRANPDGSLSMIPGGPAQVAADARADAAAARKAAEDLKASAKAQEAQQRQSESATTAQNLVSAIDTLTRSPGFSSLGTAWGDTQIAIPVIRNDAKDADAQLKNIAGQVAMATLSRLKSLSATGATGFGALSNQELQLIQNSIATLQSERISNAELRRSLKIIRDGMEKVSNWSPTKQPPAGGSDDIDSLLDMYR